MRLMSSSRFARASALLLTVLLATLGLGASPAAAQNGGGSASAGVQEYYVPGTQEQMLGVFNGLLAGLGVTSYVNATGAGANPLTTATAGWQGLIESRVSVVAYADQSVILVDRKGPSSGCPGDYCAADDYDPSHYDASFTLQKGEVYVFDQLAPGAPGDLDGRLALVGGDRIVTIGGPVFVVRASWPRYIYFGGGVFGGQVLSGYVEQYPTASWGASYGSPMGESGGPTHVDDKTTKVIVQASAGGTVVTRSAGAPASATLAQGESRVYDAVAVGETFASSDPAKPISVYVLSSGRLQVDGWFFALTPPAQLHHEYLLPLNSVTAGDRTGSVRLYLYAYDATSYNVYQGTGGTTPVVTGTLGAGQSAVHLIPNPTTEFDEGAVLNGALRVVAQEGKRLQVLAAVNSGSADWDWGFAAVGSKGLLNEYFIPWSPATGPGSNGGSGYQGYGMPVFVSPLADGTTIKVDWNADGEYDDQVALDAGQWAALLDSSDLDNTGAHFIGVRSGSSSQQASAMSGPPDGAFAIAWGEDVLADSGDGYDLGYGVLPQPAESLKPPLLTLTKTVTPEAGVAPGELFSVTLTLTAGAHDIGNVEIRDVLPAPPPCPAEAPGLCFVYKTGSAAVTLPNGNAIAAEPQVNGRELIWDLKEPGTGEDLTLPAGKSVSVVFAVTVVKPYPRDLPDLALVNEAKAYGEWCVPPGPNPVACFELRPEAFDDMNVIGKPAIDIRKQVEGADTRQVLKGSDVTFQIEVKNTGDVDLTEVAVTDALAPTCAKSIGEPGGRCEPDLQLHGRRG